MQLKVKVNDKWVEIPATTEIADDIISNNLTYSSRKIEELLANKIDNSQVGNGLKFENGQLQLDIPVASAELIHEGTTTSSVPYIEISENQKGQAFAYTHLYYEIENANGFGFAAQGASVNLRTNLNNNTAENITNTLGHSISELDKVKWIRESVSVMALGKIKKEFCWQIGSGFSRSILSGVGFSNIWGTIKKISKIKIYFTGAINEIPNGTKIKIWGWD